MRYCKYCGNPIDEDAKVCSKCGNAVEEFEPTKPAKPLKNNYAIVSFLIAILGFIPAVLSALFKDYALYYFIWYAFCIGFAVAGIVYGAKKNLKKGLAIAGLIIGLLDVVITVYCVYFFAF